MIKKTGDGITEVKTFRGLFSAFCWYTFEGKMGGMNKTTKLLGFLLVLKGGKKNIFNRPGVAGAVLQTGLSLID